MPNILIGLFVAATIAMAAPAHAQAPEQPQGDRHRIRILTMGPGSHPFEAFGHNALQVIDTLTGETNIYNYGTFDEDGPGAILSFVRGRLQFYVSDGSWEYTALYYRGRDVYAQELDLPPGGADQVAHRLIVNARPENRRYIYDHFRDNCSTRVRDQIDAVLGGLFQKHIGDRPGFMTYRWNMDAWLGPTPWLRFALHFALSKNVDDPLTRREEMFLPFMLRQALTEISLQHPDGSRRPLVKSEKKLLTRTQPRPDQPLWPMILTLAATLAPLGIGGIWGLSRWRKGATGPSRLAELCSGLGLVIYGAFGGLGGVLIASVWFTRIDDGHANANLLYVNPLHLLLVPIGLWLAIGRLRPRTARVVSVALLVNLALIAIDLLAHAVRLAHQWHAVYALYFGPAALFAWMSLRARAELAVAAVSADEKKNPASLRLQATG